MSEEERPLIPVVGPDGELAGIDTSTLQGRAEHLAVELIEAAGHPGLSQADIAMTIHRHMHGPPGELLAVEATALHYLTIALHDLLTDTEGPQ